MHPTMKIIVSCLKRTDAFYCERPTCRGHVILWGCLEEVRGGERGMNHHESNWWETSWGRLSDTLTLLQPRRGRWTHRGTLLRLYRIDLSRVWWRCRSASPSVTLCRRPPRTTTPPPPPASAPGCKAVGAPSAYWRRWALCVRACARASVCESYVADLHPEQTARWNSAIHLFDVRLRTLLLPPRGERFGLVCHITRGHYVTLIQSPKTWCQRSIIILAHT